MDWAPRVNFEESPHKTWSIDPPRTFRTNYPLFSRLDFLFILPIIYKTIEFTHFIASPSDYSFEDFIIVTLIMEWSIKEYVLKRWRQIQKNNHPTNSKQNDWPKRKNTSVNKNLTSTVFVFT